MDPAEEVRQQIQHSPDLPGVYLYRDELGKVIYVGKALSLKKRLSSYLPGLPGGDATRLPVKVAEMVQRAASLEWIVTTNEAGALLLEHNLIKQHRPPFNIRLRDDKSYPYIMVTLEDEFPRVMLTRQPHRRGNLYFGPFANAAKVRETLDVLGRVFPLRSCRGGTPGRHSGSPCLQFHIKRCMAPCRGDVASDEYKAILQQVIDFLGGRQRKVITDLQAAMKAASKRHDFEAAAAYRDRVDALQHVLEKQQIEASGLGSADILGLASDSWGANVQVFVTRDGKLADRRSFTMVNVEAAADEELMTRFVGEYYSSTPAIPAEIIVPPSIAGTVEIADFLKNLRGTNVEVRRAERGDKRRLQEMADNNAQLALAHERARDERSRERRLEGISRLEQVLRLPAPPIRIEGFDISNLGSENIVASMVVFEGGVPKKAHYRKFNVKGTAGQDDFASMHEVVGRRFASQRATDSQEYDPSFEAVPDLLLIDGGKGQLNAAVAALALLGLADAVPVVSLAKREEEVFTTWSDASISLPADDPGRLLLQRVRDEAHRFAVGFHRAKRAAQTTDSLLDQLPGIGEKRKKAIMQHFGSPERFLQASREEVEAVPGIPGKVAREVHAYLHKTG